MIYEAIQRCAWAARPSYCE